MLIEAEAVRGYAYVACGLVAKKGKPLIWSYCQAQSDTYDFYSA
jgi:hypothetical protein